MQQFSRMQLAGLLGTWICGRGCSRSRVSAAPPSVSLQTSLQSFLGKASVFVTPNLVGTVAEWNAGACKELVGVWVALFKEDQCYVTGSISFEVPAQPFVNRIAQRVLWQRSENETLLMSPLYSDDVCISKEIFQEIFGFFQKQPY